MAEDGNCALNYRLDTSKLIHFTSNTFSYYNHYTLHHLLIYYYTFYNNIIKTIIQYYIINSLFGYSGTINSLFGYSGVDYLTTINFINQIQYVWLKMVFQYNIINSLFGYYGIDHLTIFNFIIQIQHFWLKFYFIIINQFIIHKL